MAWAIPEWGWAVSPTMRPMRPFNFNTAAELFPAAIRKKKRAGFAYRRFGTAAEAVRFAIEELPADSLNGAYLQVEEARFDQSGIRSLYESEAFPLPRRPASPLWFVPTGLLRTLRAAPPSNPTPRRIPPKNRSRASRLASQRTNKRITPRRPRRLWGSRKSFR